MKPLTSQQRDTLQHATALFEQHLSGSAGQQYLAGRGIDEAAAADLRLGFVPTGTDLPGFERFAGRISIPNLNARGQVVGLKFRATTPDQEPKFDAPPGQEARLYNLQAMAQGTDYVALVEGEFDAITLHLLGVPAVAVPGADNWRGHHWRIFEGMSRVVMFYDDDQAGKRLLKTIQKQLDVVPVAPPGGCNDVNDAYLAGHGDRLVQIVKGEA